MLAIVISWLAVTTVSIAFLTSTVAIARSLGGRVRLAQLFVGPPIVRFSIAGTPFALAAVPLPTSFVAFEPAGVEAEPWRTQLHELSRARRVAIAALPWLAIALACALALGPGAALASIARAFEQIGAALLSPGHAGKALLERALYLAEHDPLHVFVARAATKMVAFNLLPLPGLAGFTILTELFVSPGNARVRRWIALAGSVVMVLLLGVWIWIGVAAFVLE